MISFLLLTTYKPLALSNSCVQIPSLPIRSKGPTFATSQCLKSKPSAFFTFRPNAPPGPPTMVPIPIESTSLSAQLPKAPANQVSLNTVPPAAVTFPTSSSSRTSIPPAQTSSYAEFLRQTIEKGKLLLHNKSSFGGATKHLTFTRDPDFFNILIHVLNSQFLSKPSLASISATCLGCNQFIKTYIDFQQHPRDISVLHHPTVPRHQLGEAFIQLAFGANLEIPLMLSCLRGEYSGDYRDINKIISTLANHGCPAGLISDISRVFTVGAPATFQARSTKSNFYSFLNYGNHSSARDFKPTLSSSIQKEIDRAYTVPLPSWLAPFIPNIHISPLGLLEKAGKKPRLIIDHSYQPQDNQLTLPSSISVNQMHGVTSETPLEYGTTFMRHLIRLYNLRISHPKDTIYLFDDDISAAFRHVKYNLFVAGAFSSIANQTLLIPCAQTFGSNTSPSNYETLALCRSFLAEKLSSEMHSNLIDLHKAYLELVRWADDKETSSNRIIATCVRDFLNKGVLVDGHPVNTPQYPFVDDSLYADLKKRILQAIAASIEACFIIFGARDDSLRPCPLSLEKFIETKCSPVRQQLGIIINTNTMCICIPQSKLAILEQLISTTLHQHRKQITVLEGATLLGNMDHIASYIPWFRHTYLTMRSSFNTAISHLKRAVEQSDDYIHLLGQSDGLSGTNLSHHQRFTAKWLASHVYSNRDEKLNLTLPLQNDLGLLRTLTSDQSLWITPIPHIIPRTPTFVAFCDSCLKGSGGYSPDLKFFWHLQWPAYDPTADEILGDDTHINILEYISILITYAIAQSRLLTDPTLAPDSYPTILIHSDNTSAVSWAQKTISSSDPIAKHVARLACLLQIHARLGLKVTHIEGENNVVSDHLSRLHIHTDSPVIPLLDQIKILQERHPQLEHCSHCPVPPNLLLRITTLLSRGADKRVFEWKMDNELLSQGKPSTLNGCDQFR
jgi:hypothetical protein